MPARPRRFAVALCLECDWSVALRVFRSQRTRGLATAARVAQRHLESTEHWDAEVRLETLYPEGATSRPMADSQKSS